MAKQLPAAVSLALSLTAWVRPAEAFQSNVSLGVRAGTLGFGAEVVTALDERVAVRAGAGFLGFDVDLTGRFGLAGNRTAELSLPTALLSLGVEFSLASGLLRAGGGMVLRSNDPVHVITYESGASISIGGGGYRYPEVLTVTTTMISGTAAPYLLVGLGSNSGSGLGFVFDLGAVVHLSPRFEMTATGDPQVMSSPGFRADLEAERRQAEEDAATFVNFWPVVSVGLRYGIG
ncbi:MAG: hypothetical protein OXN18_14645 [Gemmatimonadota bacterium]|nr:hypothetical protein [Gemmatimonadota bacterium]